MAKKAAVKAKPGRKPKKVFVYRIVEDNGCDSPNDFEGVYSTADKAFDEIEASGMTCSYSVIRVEIDKKRSRD